MKNYTVFVDSACDLSYEMLDNMGVKCIPLTFKFDDSEREYKDNEITKKEFYDKIRAGGFAKTSGVNVEAFKTVFEEELKAGKDVLCVVFSSGLSVTYNSARIAAEQLKEIYPERKIVAVDSLCASAGSGLILYLLMQKIQNGATIEDAEKFIMDTRLNVCHWYTMDELKYLKRGGRISAATALAGGLLGIKPIMHMDNEGKLASVSKVKGKNAALKALADKYEELALDKENGTVFVSHADCLGDINKLEEIFIERFGKKFDYIADIGSVIGSHTGPGVVAVFFLGKER